MSPVDLEHRRELIATRREQLLHTCWHCGRLFLTSQLEWTIEALRVCEITEEPWPEDGDDFPQLGEV